MSTAIPRVDQMPTPPAVGQSYLVWTVNGRYFDRVADWPILGPIHDDREFIGFEMRHYHIDWRFIRLSSFARASVRSSPLHAHDDCPLSEPALRRRKCLEQFDYLDLHHPTIYAMQRAFKGRQCATGPGGFICPHRGMPLGTVPAKDGVITCPQHGLRFDAATGVCLGTWPSQEK